jgi:hypothetical protein
MVLIDLSKYDVFPTGLDIVRFYDLLDDYKDIPKLPYSWWQYIYFYFKPPNRVKRIDHINQHPNIYWDGRYLPSNPPQITIRYNPKNITKTDVEDFMYSLGGYVVVEE